MGIFWFIKRLKKRKNEKKLREQIELARIEQEFPLIFKKKPIAYSRVYQERCEFRGCKEKLASLTRYECQYCHKQFCEKHRLPENHKCKNPKLPYYMRLTGQKRYREEYDNI